MGGAPAPPCGGKPVATNQMKLKQVASIGLGLSALIGNVF